VMKKGLWMPKGYQKTLFEEKHTIQWPKEKEKLVGNIVLRVSLPLEGSSSLIHDMFRLTFCFIFLLYKRIGIFLPQFL
jgi:hypothetical protein